MDLTATLPGCPFCGGRPRRAKEIRDGYQECAEDEDAWAHFIVCNSCAAQGGWAKSREGAERLWRARQAQPKTVSLIEAGLQMYAEESRRG